MNVALHNMRHSLNKKQLTLKKIAIILLLLIVAGVLCKVVSSSMDKGYMPKQPIPFSHKIHAGDNKIECMYCHFNADKSRHATVPTMTVCMGCHTHVATDRPNIKKMKDLYDKGESFEWVKIHHVPEHVYFPHNKHIAAGVSCAECHGAIEEMDVVKQDKEFTMGFCLQCHRDNNYVNKEESVGSINYKVHHQRLLKLGDSIKYDDVVNLKEAQKKMEIHPLTHMNASTDCSTCHQ